MTHSTLILAIDQGTSCTKALLLGLNGEVVAKGAVPVGVSYTQHLVEQSPTELYQSVLGAVRLCLDGAMRAGIPNSAIKAVGITNQRETFVLWDSRGEPLYPAVSWQCKRSSAICDDLGGYETFIKDRTGLIVDPYFSSTKVKWLMEHVPGIASAISNGEVYFGTIDTWLLYCLTKGRQYLTDHTNASRTMLFNIHRMEWDSDLIALLGLEGLQLPAACPSVFDYGATDFEGLLDRPIPITAMIGDSQAATVGSDCLQKGQAKATLGTGCSVMMTVGEQLTERSVQTVDAICYSTPDRVVYATEGIIVSCGATVEWLMNQLGLFSNVADSEMLARQAPPDHGVYLLPAFSGMGTPYWRKNSRAVIANLSFASDRNCVVRAALESVGFQVCDVVKAMEQEHGVRLTELTVNGGMASNGFVLQFLSNLLDIPVYSNAVPDASAFGCAFLAATQLGVGSFSLGTVREWRHEVGPDGGQSQVLSAYDGWLSCMEKML